MTVSIGTAAFAQGVAPDHPRFGKALHPRRDDGFCASS